MDYNYIRNMVHKFGGRMSPQRDAEDLMFDGKQYEYCALFNDDETADEFLDTIEATKSDREIPSGSCLTVYFSVPG